MSRQGPAIKDGDWRPNGARIPNGIYGDRSQSRHRAGGRIVLGGAVLARGTSHRADWLLDVPTVGIEFRTPTQPSIPNVVGSGIKLLYSSSWDKSKNHLKSQMKIKMNMNQPNLLRRVQAKYMYCIELCLWRYWLHSLIKRMPSKILHIETILIVRSEEKYNSQLTKWFFPEICG